MPAKKGCVQCRDLDCPDRKQWDFDMLQVQSPHANDKRLVEARMLGVVTSGEFRNKASEANKANKAKNGERTQGQSDYSLKRLMASLNKISTFLRRRPRASTHMQASEKHGLAGAAESKQRCNSY